MCRRTAPGAPQVTSVNRPRVSLADGRDRGDTRGLRRLPSAAVLSCHPAAPPPPRSTGLTRGPQSTLHGSRAGTAGQYRTRAPVTATTTAPASDPTRPPHPRSSARRRTSTSVERPGTRLATTSGVVEYDVYRDGAPSWGPAPGPLARDRHGADRRPRTLHLKARDACGQRLPVLRPRSPSPPTTRPDAAVPHGPATFRMGHLRPAILRQEPRHLRLGRQAGRRQPTPSRTSIRASDVSAWSPGVAPTPQDPDQGTGAVWAG